MTPQQPPGATNTARSVTVDGSDHSSPHRATQGENVAVLETIPELQSAIEDELNSPQAFVDLGSVGGTRQLAVRILAKLQPLLAPDLTVRYLPCRYVLFEGEGGGCIGNAVDDGYCQPHADALRELHPSTEETSP